MCPKPKIRVRAGNRLCFQQKGRRARRLVEIDGFLLQLFHARDLTITSRPRLVASARCLTMQRALTNPSFRPPIGRTERKSFFSNFHSV
jgi:hypothetical protein